ncbi:stomatin-like protein 3 isoform X2 [Strigops habroptila]|uniref:stomatin-like protein 3 isoform X2 n=1 Tax=Strigops habroptila TaxID=2489341 RepID=UPI0011D0354B|nr:stomatin-like protein 3 isoform X2 [Strigops habroptila]
MDPQKETPKENKTEHLIADRREGIGVCGWILVSFSFLLVLITFPISIWMCMKVIREYERAVVFRLGRILSKKAKGPGIILILPCTDTFIKVDLRTVTCNIPPQEILTKDAVTTQVDGVLYYRIHSAVSAVANVTDVHSATFLLAQATLRNVLGTQTLAQLLAGREEIAHSIQVVAAEGEMNASKALKQASMVLAESPAGLQLRYLQTLTDLAAENNSTIVFPLPINMLVSLGQKSKGG